MESACDHADRKAAEREDFTIACVECLFRVFWNVQLGKEHSFDKCISLVVLQAVYDSTESINYAAHSRVGSPNHGEFGFCATKKRVNRVLFGAGAPEKPAVVGHRNKNLRATQGELSGKISQGVLKADEGANLHRFLRHTQNDRLSSEIEIIRHQIADNPRKERKRIAQRNVLAEGNQMNLVVDLCILRRSR